MNSAIIQRFLKEKLHIRYYSRYMDDCVLIHADKDTLRECLKQMREYIEGQLNLEFNEKTQVFPLRNGVRYLGWHLYLNEYGKVVRRVSSDTKLRFKHRLRKLQTDYAQGRLNYDDAKMVINSYLAHLQKGHSYHLRKAVLQDFVLKRKIC